MADRLPTKIIASPAAPPTVTGVPAPASVRLAPGLGTLIAWAAAACVLTLIDAFAGRFVPIPSAGSLSANLIAVPYLLLLLLCLLQAGRAAARLPVGAAFEGVAGAVLALPALARLLLTGLSVARPQFAPLLTEFDTISAALPPGIPELINNFFAPIGLVLLGSAVGRIIKHPNTLLAGAGFAIFFDIVVVTMGTVAQLLRSNAALIAAVSVGAGAAPPATAPLGPHHGMLHPIEPLSWVTIGPADVLFMAVFLAAVRRLRLAERATFLWMFALLGAALAIVQTTALPIPALAPMGIAVLLANAKHAAFTAQERRDLKIGAVFALFCAALMVLGARHFAPPPPPPPLGFAFAVDPAAQTLIVRNVAPGSRAERSGMRPGDAVTGINGAAFSKLTPDQVGAALMAARADGGTFTIHRPGAANPLTLTLPAAEKH